MSRRFEKVSELIKRVEKLMWDEAKQQQVQLKGLRNEHETLKTERERVLS